MSLNKVQLIGNLTRDPELRQIPGGQTVATFGIATNFTWNDQSGQKQSKTEFHNIVVWRKLAEICAQYLRKGSKVYIEGRLQTRDWEGEDGVKRYRTEIICENMIMLDRKGDAVAVPIEGGARENAGIANNQDAGATQNQPVAAGGDAGASDGEGEKKKEEDVSIDDLPF